MIHHFEITADLPTEEAGELLFAIKEFLDEHEGELLAFIAEQKDSKEEATA